MIAHGDLRLCKAANAVDNFCDFLPLCFLGKDGRHLHEDGAMSMVQNLNQLSGAALAVVALFGAGMRSSI
jgi:hypothetical protein